MHYDSLLAGVALLLGVDLLVGRRPPVQAPLLPADPRYGGSHLHQLVQDIEDLDPINLAEQDIEHRLMHDFPHQGIPLDYRILQWATDPLGQLASDVSQAIPPEWL